MTSDARRRLTPLEMAKALHPAASSPSPRPRRDEVSSRSSPAPAVSARPDHGVLVVLWAEEECRARLRSVVQGWLSGTGCQGRLPISIAAVEGDEVLLVARVTPAFGGAGSERVGALELEGLLEVEGVTGEQRRWAVRASGPLQTVVPDPPRRSTEPDRFALRDPLGAGGFTVLALTIRSIRGFEIA